MSAGRPREFDHQQALESAMRVFWTRGYEATSLDDLLKEMDLSKSSFYQAFGSKAELFQKCLAHYRDTSAQQLQASLTGAAKAWDFIRTTLEAVADGTGKKMGRAGCLLMNTATEFGQRDAEVSSTVSAALLKMQDLFQMALERAKKEGDLPKSADTQSLSLFLATNLGGLKGMARAGAAPQAIRSVVRIVLGALK